MAGVSKRLLKGRIAAAVTVVLILIAWGFGAYGESTVSEDGLVHVIDRTHSPIMNYKLQVRGGNEGKSDVIKLIELPQGHFTRNATREAAEGETEGLRKAIIVDAEISTGFLHDGAVWHDSKGCIDGDTSTFCHTMEGDTDPYLLVKLGGVYNVSHVTVWNRQGCCTERSSPFVIELGLRSNVLNGCAVLTRPFNSSVTMECTGLAQYVKVVLPGVRTLNLAEVDVFGTPQEIDESDDTLVHVHRKSGFEIYWDRSSPVKTPTERFLTFEPWHGGPNNRRMSLELAAVIAYVTNRTLVLPPRTKVHHLDKPVGYEDFYDITDLSRQVPLLTYAEYRILRPLTNKQGPEFFPLDIDLTLAKEAEVGGFRFRTANDVPGRDPSAWELLGKVGDAWVVLTAAKDETPTGRLAMSKTYKFAVKKVAQLKWRVLAQRSLVGIPEKGPCVQASDVYLLDAKGEPITIKSASAPWYYVMVAGQSPTELLDNNVDTKFYAYIYCAEADESMSQYDRSQTINCFSFIDERNGVRNTASVRSVNFVFEFFAYPRNPKAPAKVEDIKAFSKGRTGKDWPLEQDKASVTLHFPENLFSTWYTSIWFENREIVPELARAVRDGVHYHSRIYQRATKIINFLGDYTCMHIRRGDFQEFDSSVTSSSSQAVFNFTKWRLHPHEKLYIATDETNDEFFDVFDKNLPGRVFRLKDVMMLMEEWTTPSMWLGPIEQIICSHGRLFIGTRQSTFTTYIHRLRGYLRKSTQWVFHTEEIPQQPVLPTNGHFYSWTNMPSVMFWSREYPEGWTVD